uniref:Putative glycosyltransferase n=1 Tax=viral metagenome TaxID=1070528 RepID=A0A6M3LAU9_9ZZZZ
MKILALFHDNVGDVRGVSRRLHLEFLLKLNDFYDLKLYGPDMHLYNDKTLVPLLYNKSHSMKFIVNEIKPHIILCLSNILTKKWLPNDFKLVSNIAKVILEGDYHDVDNKNWYEDNNFNLVIHRSAEFNENVPSVWMPLAADECFYTDMKDINHKDRIKMVSFFGTRSNYKYYDVRRLAIETLEKENILCGRNDDKDLEKHYQSKDFVSVESKKGWGCNKENYRYIVGYDDYPKKLKECVCSLSCAGGELKGAVGKIFEIMASGTTLLTQMFSNSEILFGHRCCVFYKRDCSDIVRKARKIINDADYSEYIAKNAVEAINKHHLAYHRMKELCNILEALYYGKDIPRKWGK